jgi:hypothetical protein
VDPFVVIIGGLVVGLIGWLLLLGRFHPRSGADTLQWRPTRSPEMEAQNEVDDLHQMLSATNERRRARGEPELTEEVMEARVREDRRLADEVRERHLADEDLQQMLAATNERRVARGDAAITEAEFRAQLDADRDRLGRG